MAGICVSASNADGGVSSWRGLVMLDFGFYNMDCMEGMKQFPDKYFDLAIVDPPYGINIGRQSMGIGGALQSIALSCIMLLMIRIFPTKHILMSLRELANTELYGGAITSLIISAKQKT